MLEVSREFPGDGHDPVATGSKRPSNGDAAQRAKRVRVSRACDQCRAGREKCDGARPWCQTCESQGRTCTYNEQPKKRGIQPNYIRTLELTLAWAFENFPDSEKRLSQLLPNTQARAHQLIAWKDTIPAEGLHNVWRNSIVCKQIDQMLSGAEIELPRIPQSGHNRQASYTEESDPQRSYQSPPMSAPSDGSLLPQGPIEAPAATASAVSPREVSSAPRPEVTAQSQVATSQNVAPDEDLLKLPKSSWLLLEHYFAFTHTWLPMVERHDVLKLMYSYPHEGLRREDTTVSGHAELWSIMAIASLQNGATADFEYCRGIARSLIPREHGFQLGHIKCLLILGLADIMQQAWVSAWLVFGSAIRLLTHFNFGKGTRTTLFEGRTKHTLLAAFVLERAVASQTGAVTHIRPGDIQNVGFLIEDGLEEWSPWQDPQASSSTAKSPARSMSTFNELVRLSFQAPGDLDPSSPQSANAFSLLGAILGLLRNASDSSKRLHPQQALANARATSLVDTVTPQEHTRTGSTLIDFSSPFVDSNYPFMSIPNDRTQSLVTDNLSGSMQPIAGPSQWNSNNRTVNDLQEAASAAGDPGTVNSAHGADIFEELAMLDRTDSTGNNDFMQNLGFGPDLDLAEFFGADYQPSDPLLTYMRPNTYNGTGQDFDASGDGAG
ncbi:Quinic acid utilization activator [Cercospora beticola]|uniref:Quinic acid utilization activator n=1 Tax=Cercospora beticola TaxID=122368 RepID=A0A2G5HY69_CERBT|nr:Quinic acid utilization activator [Cercospora beticola]PIA97441.1 Quinic acid utilization activator [Cercospora beticola]WPA98749.1 hypothetical protein RHO25_003362 [Cercospora beticola]